MSRSSARSAAAFNNDLTQRTQLEETMNTTTALTEDEIRIEYFSSHAARAAKRRKTIRRRIIILMIAAPKILGILYFGHAGLAAATAADGPFGMTASIASHP
jgi:hypothetical protein